MFLRRPCARGGGHSAVNTPHPCPLPRQQKYYNVRASYIAAFFDVINWKGVSAAYAKAKAGTFSSLDVLKPAANWATRG